MAVQRSGRGRPGRCCQEVIKTVSDTSSMMLERASKEDVAGFQSFTMRTLNSKQSTSSDIDQYKLVNVKEDALDNRQKYLDVMCFPDFFPSGRFGEYHPREVPIITKSEYAKSRLLNKDARFRKDPATCSTSSGRKSCANLLLGCTTCSNPQASRGYPLVNS